MRNTTVSVQRPDGTTIASGIAVQIDQMSAAEMLVHAQLEGFRVVDRYKLFTQWWPILPDGSQIRRGDVLLDERDTNYETSAAYKYRVTSLPKLYDMDHEEMVVEVVTGA